MKHRSTSVLGGLCALLVPVLTLAQSVANAPASWSHVAALPDAAAAPDTTAPWRYFPLHVGNIWEYEEGDYLHRFYVEKDTLIGTRRYFKQVHEFYNRDTIRTYVQPWYLRYDTTTHEVRLFTVGREFPYNTGCPFNVGFDVSIECDFVTHRVRGQYDGVLVFGEGAGRGTDTVRTSVKSFDSGSAIFIYAAGVGLAYWDAESSTGLSYYRVNGVERGRARIVVAAEPEGQPPTRELVIEAVYPNPFRDRFSVRYHAGRAQPVTVGVFDALGRRVRDLSAYAAAEETVEFEGGALAPGSYFVRVCADSGTCATRPVVKAP